MSACSLSYTRTQRPSLLFSQFVDRCIGSMNKFCSQIYGTPVSPADILRYSSTWQEMKAYEELVIKTKSTSLKKIAVMPRCTSVPTYQYPSTFNNYTRYKNGLLVLTDAPPTWPYAICCRTVQYQAILHHEQAACRCVRFQAEKFVGLS